MNQGSTQRFFEYIFAFFFICPVPTRELMESSQKKRKRWSDAETQALLQEAIEMRIFRHIDGKKHKNKDVSGNRCTNACLMLLTCAISNNTYLIFQLNIVINNYKYLCMFQHDNIRNSGMQ